MFVSMFLEQVASIVENSEIAHLLKYGPPEYSPGGVSYRDDIMFESFATFSEVGVVLDLRSERKHEEVIGEEDDGRLVKQTPYEIQKIAVVSEAAGEMTLLNAQTMLDTYGAVLRIARQIKRLTTIHTVVDRFYERPKPDEPDQIDRIAADPDAQSLLQSDKEGLKSVARDHDLSVSGTKEEIRTRIVEFAQEQGDPEVVEVYEDWRDDRYVALDEG